MKKEETTNKKNSLKKLIIIFIFFLILIISCLFYSRFVEIKNIKIKEYKIINKNIVDEYYGLKIVHITDIHYGKVTFEKELKELVKKINLTKPDIVVLTGDLIDKDTKLTTEDADKISFILSKIETTIGKYAIIGDNDCKFNNWNFIIENSNFINLNDKYDLIYKNSKKNILITGLSSNLYNKKSVDNKLKESTDYLKNIKEDEKPIYSILLMHEPDNIDEVNLNNYDLVLAGHSLNGQVKLPLIGGIFIPSGAKKYYNSFYRLEKTKLYISSGIGTTNNKFRLFNKPSFNLYRLTN